MIEARFPTPPDEKDAKILERLGADPKFDVGQMPFEGSLTRGARLAAP